MKQTLLTIALVAITGFSYAQQAMWTSAVKKSNSTVVANKASLFSPRLFELDTETLKQSLSNSPSRFAGQSSKVVVSFPNADGQMERFRVTEFSNMDPELASRYPEIRSYVGKGLDTPGSIVYFSMSPLGLQTMTVYPDRSAVFIEPYTTDQSSYVVYRKADKAANFGDFECRLAQTALFNNGEIAPLLRPNADDGNLRNYRLAMSVTGEYTAYFGGTKALALAAINNTMTRVNAIFEMDFGVHMNLISNTDAVIYTSASSDPYSGASQGAGGAWNQQLQTTLTNVIGSANYDIGHLFGASGGGGNAGCIGCVCKNPTSSAPLGKGSGYTSPADGIPQGDNFDIDYVAHEMGHQFGANHTFTHSNEGTGAQMEPGSGSTIMGYAGITGATNDVQPHSDAYFHAYSIQQVTNYVKTTTCQTTTVTGNAIPTANAGIDRTIPKGTPFMLTGVATDSNGADVLTYDWEQMNAGTSTSTIPSATRTSGPAFRSIIPSTSPTRYFPRLQTVQSGLTAWKWEVVPTVARTMNFRLTVRDNHIGGPANNSDDIIITVNATAGPFTVSAPNTAVSYPGGSAQTVTWNVAGTTANGVNCANVDIMLSTDGGNTFSTMLLAGTPNDGSQSVVIPNTPGSANRIIVKGSNHIFYDMSNVNFTITAGSTDTVAPSTPTLSASGTTQTTTNLSWTASTDNVGVTGYDVYQNGVFKANVSGTTYTVTGLTASTTYSFTVRAKDAAGNASVASNIVNVTTLAPAADTTAPSAPVLSASGTTSTTTNLSWTASTDNVGVTGYDVYQGAILKASVTGTTYSVTGLSPATAYSFTVRAKDAAGNVSVSSNSVTVTTLSTTLNYCASQGNSVVDELIQRVQFNTINNPSTGGTGYTNFTAISTNVTRGSAYTITITPQWTGTVYSEGYAVWIDYNIDGDFTDAGELVFSRTASKTTPVSGTITIPASALTGSTRMRVSMKYNGVPTSCETFSYGQVEDYTVNIASARESDALAFTIYPNPVKDGDLNIAIDFNNPSYRIVNMLGQQVAFGTIENGTIAVSNLASGTYLLEVSADGKSAVKRFIKQ